uniref:Sterol regulatory element-binding protein ECM22 n=1 Tax=Talaromyces marneffei PM1 TaxID=1077442 RepID=A0A093V027_TALMA
MTKPQLPRRRTYKPKVQTGCIQCKGARIKCPEQRPACARCQRLALDCCYLPPKSKQQGQNQKRAASMRRILPATAIRIRTPPSSSLSSRCDLEPGGGIYLECFREQVALMDQDLDMTDFWFRTVLRASHTDDSITYAIASIGALARTRKHSSRWLFRNPDPHNQEESAHYHTAVMYHNKAITTFRRYIASSKPDDADVHRTILIITVLFVVLEIFHGNNRAADALTGSGILLLKDKMLHSLGITGVSRSSSLAGLIDDQGIVEAELFLTRCAALCSKAFDLAPYAHADGMKAMLMMPSSGLNVPPPPDGDASIKTFSFQFLNLLTAILIWHTRVRAQRHLDIISFYKYPEFFQQQRELLTQLRGWMESYKAQLKRRHTTNILHYFERQSLFTKLAYIIVSCELDPTGNLWDSMAPDCAELTPKFRAHLDAELDDQSKPDGSLISLENTFMWAIFLTAATNVSASCRDRSVRLAWIHMAEIATNMSFLKHLRGNVMATALFIRAEEEGRDKAGVIPPSSRYDLDTATWNEDSGQIPEDKLLYGR